MIIVTGPQRSGTRLASHIIARDTKLTYVDEFDYNLDVDVKSVIQSPALLKSVVELSFMYPTAKFAFMYRNVDDIVASLERVEWYKDYVTDPTFYRTYVEHCYKYIDLLKKELPKERWFDIHYESLVCDPYFVSDRSDFTTMQCFADKPVGPKLWRNDDYIRSNTG